MLRYFIVLLFLWIAQPAYSTSTQYYIDSLEQELATSQDLHQQIDLCLGIARMYSFNSEYDKEKTYLDQAAKLLENTDFNWGHSQLYQLLSQHDAGQGNLNASISNLFKSRATAKAAPQNEGQVIALYHLAGDYANKGYNKQALAVLDTAMQLMQQSTSYLTIGNVYKWRGTIYQSLGQLDAAIDALEKAAYYFEQFPNHPFDIHKLNYPSALHADKGALLVGQAYLYLARPYTLQGNHAKAIENIERAVANFRILKSDHLLAFALMDAGTMHNRKGDYKTALDRYQASMKLYEQMDNNYQMASCQRSMGIMYYNLEDFQAAKEIFNKSLDVYAELNDTLAQIYVLKNLGPTEVKIGDFDAANTLLSKGVGYAQAIGNKAEEGYFWRKSGELANQKGDYPKAIQYAHRAIPLVLTNKDTFDVMVNHRVIAYAYAQQNELDSALLYSQKALTFAQRKGAFKDKMDSYQLHSRILKQRQEFEPALAAHEHYILWKDSLYTNDAQAKLKEEQVRQNVVAFQAEKEAATREAELLSTQNKLYLALAVALLALLLLGLYLYRQLMQTKRTVEQQNNELKNLNRTKDRFFSIIAHDIRSPLVIFQGVGDQFRYYLEKNKTDKLYRLADQLDGASNRLSNLLDNLLNWALIQQGQIPNHPEKLSVAKEVEEILALYESSAQTKGIEIKADINPALYAHIDANAFSTIVRNLISNALKYTPKNGQIRVNAKADNKQVKIAIEDNGIGIPTERLNKLFMLDKKSLRGTHGEKGTGLGLILCKELVEINKGQLSVNSESGKGSIFNVEIPRVAA